MSEEAKRPVVYAIAAPSLVRRPAWPKIRRAVKAKAKNARIAQFEDVFSDPATYQETWQQKLAEFDGAIVIPSRRGDIDWIGHVAEREADFLTGTGHPVFLFDRAGLIPWPQVKLDHPDTRPPALPLQVITDAFRSAP